MAYCVQADLKKLLPETMLISLTNDIAGAVSINKTNQDEAIDQADREIDAYLVIAGYSVPIDPVPPLIANLSANMTIWHLHLRKYFKSDVWEKTYERCLHLLERIAEGKLGLGQMQTGVVADASGGVATESNTQKFTTTEWATF